MSWKKNFPPKDGWIKAELTLRSPLTEQEVKDMITFFFRSPEVGSCTQSPKKIVLIYRPNPGTGKLS